MVKNKQKRKIRYWLAMPVILAVIIIGILLITSVITFDVTQLFFGWFLIILGAYSLTEIVILKWLGI